MALFGPYWLTRRIAVGGMAEVYLACREGPGGYAKVVALKRMLPHLTEAPEFVTMFLDEARIAARLSHPHIVQLHDFGEIEGVYFLAMEYIPGEDLQTILRTARRRGIHIPPPLVATILSQACDALHYAHELCDANGAPLGVVHRDVTPSNLIISYDGVVKLADFGIAKAESRLTRTITTSPKGKYPYMSPEQALGRPLDRRSDLFSLGVVAHELTTGRTLFRRENELLVLKAITEEPIPLPGQFRRTVPPALQAVVMHALERDPEERFPTAQAMQLEVDRLGLHGGDARLSLGRFLSDLFGEEAASTRRRWAAGEDEAFPTTRALQRATRAAGRSRLGRGIKAVAVGLFVVGLAAVGALAWWRPGQARGSAEVAATASPPAALDAASLAPTPTAAAAETPPTAAPAETPPTAAPTEAPAETPPAETPPAEAPPVSGRAASPKHPAGPAAQRGRGPALLTVDVGAPFEAALDGRPLGTTPLNREKIPPGRHTLVLTGPEGNRLKMRFVARAGEEHVERKSVGTGSLSCDVAPWAEVYIGSRKLGTTPLASVPLPEGTYTLRLHNPELGEKKLSVTVRAGEKVRVRTRFE